MNLTKIRYLRSLLLAAYGWGLVSATQVFADCNSSPSSCKLDEPNSLGIPQVSIASAVADIIAILSFVAGILAIIFIIVAGIRYTTSSGNTQRTESAKQTLLYAVIGLIISTLAFSIVSFIIAKGP